MFGKKSPEPDKEHAHERPEKEGEGHGSLVLHEDAVPGNASNKDVFHNRSDNELVETGFTQSAKSGQGADKIASYRNIALETEGFVRAKLRLLEQLVEQIDFIALGKMEQRSQRERTGTLIDKLISSMQLPLNHEQIQMLKEQLADELFGFGPLEPLLQDPEISDIMVNSAKQVYVEKQGKLIITDVTFYDEAHLLGIIQRIVSRVGRRIDESSPMVDARMPDGSRFNAIIPPLALDGSLVSIRKFKQNKMPLEAYIHYGSMSPQMAKFLHICGHVGLNIIISGGTGSGKTTLLNALSGAISFDERIITIEDAAELQLQQPHVLRLETRPASMEGKGEITQRQLVKNALRMRPDRIILGEIRGGEVIDVLSAMNTGHDGSMATIHANNPRDCLSRIENLVGMSGVTIGIHSLRKQISSAIQIIVQIERQRDGKRRITSIEEIAGMEGEVITTQTLFSFDQRGISEKDDILGDYVCHAIRPKMIERARFYGKDREVLECMKMAT